MPFKYHPNQIPLEGDAIIWRYMDITKYLSLLERSALFFCRADKFSDPFEGTIPKKEFEHRPKEARMRAEFQKRPFDEEKSKRNIEGLTSLHKKFKRGIIINCWHINNSESDAMWRLYLKDNEGVAIQSTALRLMETLRLAPDDIEMSKIRYIDFDKDGWFHAKDYPHRTYNLIVPYFHKRLEFVHEQECRLYYEVSGAIDKEEYWDSQENRKGKFLRVDLNTLVEAVYLPPTVEKKTMEKTIEQTKALGFDFKFIVSKLQSEPYY